MSEQKELIVKRAGHYRFLAALFLIATVLLSIPYLAVYSDALYCRHSKLFWNGTDCFKYGLHGNNADIVLIGDSSLVFGVRPDVIKRQTGLTAFNLGLPAGAVLFFPDLLLDRYLAMNRTPEIVVIYASPWTFTDNPAGLQHLMDDALRFTIRHGSPLQVLRVFYQDPAWIIRFPALAVEQGEWRHMTLSGEVPQHMSDELRRGNGWLSYRDMSDPETVPVSLRDDCLLQAKPLADPDQKKINRIRTKYGRLGIKVFFYVAPVPSCDQTYQDIVSKYAGVADSPPRTLPSTDFIDDDWRVHLDAIGATEATEQLVNFLRHAEDTRRGSKAPG